MTIVPSSPEDQFRAKYEEQAEKIGRFNLAIFGKTGVGKSTLINAFFGEDVAPTGIGQPVTTDFHLYLHQSAFFGLLDTQGLEIGKDTKTLIREMKDYIDRTRKKPESEQIHVAWYCVRASDRRFEDTEADFVRSLHALGLPVIVVLTQVASREGELHSDAVALADYIASLGLPIEGGRPISVMAAGDSWGQESHGLQELLDATFRAAPDGVASALAAAQKIDLARKRKEAATAIGLATGAAAGIGAIPIPVADAGLIVPVQLGLMGKIAAIYGVKLETATIAATVATAVATAAGRGTVIGLLKLVPGAGTLVGGAISAATAAAFTSAMGYAWATVCAQLSQGRLKGLDGAIDAKAVQELFLSELTKWLRRKPGSAPPDSEDADADVPKPA
ncbi:GTP-binding protein [soil metagenome]